MNSFIPWIGGKSQLRKTIIEAFPTQGYTRYVEVFGGAAWVLFGKDRHAELEVLNDIDGNLINLYRCIQYHSNELQRELKLCEGQIIPNSRELFFDYLAQLNTRGLTDIQRAARYFYVIRTSYGADRRSFGCNKKGYMNAIERLSEIQDRLKDVVIENQSFEGVIKTYNKPKTLFFLDPPYFKTEDKYEGFSPDDHQRLFKSISSIKEFFLLTYNDAPEIRELYHNYHIKKVERKNNLSAGQYKELIITNY